MVNVTLCSKCKEKPDESSLSFGKYYTDHIFKMYYSPDKGWHNAAVEPYASFVLDPAVMTFHYGQAIFEGLKAFIGKKDGKITLFRPWENFARMNRSAARMCIPAFDEQLALKGLLALIKADKEWIPKSDGTSLYIRPTIIATDRHLGVRASDTYLFYIMLSPVAAYYANGFAPVSLYVEDYYTRSSLGGTGEAKCSGNYAASIIAGEKANKLGFDQVLWLDSCEKKYVEEVGSMNIFFIIDGTAVTPKLDGTILPGITRDSIIKLLQAEGIPVSQRRISITAVIEKARNGQLTEAFGTGTAAVVSPVGSLTYGGSTVKVGGGGCGQITQRMYDTLTGIQKGVLEDKFGWLLKPDI